MRDYLRGMQQRWDETTPKLRLESEIRAGVEGGSVRAVWHARRATDRE
jgi:hypothetical protein